MANITCFGEVLWDVYPKHKKIGGAPLNVASRLSAFNNYVNIISSIGDDEKGLEILEFLKTKKLNYSSVQKNENFKTSEVHVNLDKNGSASYTIEYPCAWDFIEINDSIRDLVKDSDAFVYGSLIARNNISYNTLLELLPIAKYKVFDVNLRPPHYKIDVLLKLMYGADFIKFNDDELFEISANLDFKSKDLKKNIHFISEKTNTKTVCVTLGDKGAVLYINKCFYYNSGYKVKVVDTVGAGDSFLASVIHKLLKKETPQKAIDFACAVGALVASNSGANPIISKEEIDEFIEKSKSI